MLALMLAFAVQVDAGTEAGPAAKLVATSTIAWIADAAKKGDGIIVVHHRRGVCPPSHAAACGAAVFDQDVHSLRAVSLASGKEKWRNTKTPLLLGELRLESDETVAAIVAADLSVSNVALLDPATGKTLAACANAVDAGGEGAHSRFQSRHVDATGAFFVQRMFLKNGGAPPPPVPSLVLRATSVHACSLVEGPANGPLSWPREDERVQYGGDGARGHIDVTIDGRTRRIVVDEQPKCRRFNCRPIP